MVSKAVNPLAMKGVHRAALRENFKLSWMVAYYRNVPPIGEEPESRQVRRRKERKNPYPE